MEVEGVGAVAEEVEEGAVEEAAEEEDFVEVRKGKVEEEK